MTPPEPAPGTLPERHAAIAFADIVGWSVLAGADERRSAAAWSALVRGTLAPAATSLGGRVVDVFGDGALAEFADVTAALHWAEAAHAAAEAEGASRPDEPPFAFRIAVHAGRVMADGERLLGDAVNLAARLQEFGTPGGTILSDAAAAAAPTARVARARDLGALPLRGLGRSVRAVSLDPARPVAVPLAPPPASIPSVAVLPLENLGEGPTDDYLAAGVVEDVAASLAGLHELFVIAPESARVFQGAPSPTPQRVGRVLGVRYAVMGTLRRGGGGFRATLRLVDTATGAQLWSERVDAAERDVFEVQERVVERVVAGLAPSIRAAQLREAMRKRPESLTAYDHMLRGVHAMASADAQGFLGAAQHFDLAMAQDAGFALPKAWAAYWHTMLFAKGLRREGAEDTERLFRLCEEALALDPGNALALGVYGHNLSFRRRSYEAALAHFETALRGSPGSATTLTFASATHAYVGRGEEAVWQAERAIRLSPVDPVRFYQHLCLAIARYVVGDLPGAEKALRVSLSVNSGHAPAWRMLAAVLAAQGRLDEARDATHRLLGLDPAFRLARYNAERNPFAGEAGGRFAALLAAAGVPV